MTDYGQNINDLFDMFAKPKVTPALRFGFVEPEREPSLPFEQRLTSRLACNRFILENLRAA